jgi:predicted transcriptional regulator
MDKKLSKKEFVGVRKVLGLTQVELSELLDVSLIHIRRTEGKGVNSYEVSNNLDKAIKEKLKQLGMNLDEILEVIHKGGV